MSVKNLSPDILKAAKKLAEANAQSDVHVSEIYLFPSNDEIRLIEIDDTCFPNGEKIEPFYFAPDAEGEINYNSAIALILPEEKDKLNPPENWGDWSDAIKLYPEKNN